MNQEPTRPSDPVTIRGACHHDCPDTCVWDATVVDGRVTRLRGNPDHPATRGGLCPKVNRYVDRVYHQDRILQPLRRVGPKGSAEFEEISWEDAIEEIALRLTDVVGSSGPEAVLQYSFAGTQGARRRTRRSEDLEPLGTCGCCLPPVSCDETSLNSIRP